MSIRADSFSYYVKCPSDLQAKIRYVTDRETTQAKYSLLQSEEVSSFSARETLLSAGRGPLLFY